MTGFILGEKSDQSQTFDNKGERIPTTFIKTANCYLLDIITPQKRGYFAVKLGFGQGKNSKKPVQGELTKAGIKTPLRFFREIRLDFPVSRKEILKDKVQFVEEAGKKGLSIKDVKIFQGEPLKPEVLFKKGDKISVSGISKGKGFQGVVKRHHFKGGPRTHGQSHSERAPGSVGMTTTPGRLFKGKRMAGRMGRERVTVTGLEVVEVKEDGITVKGLVPGYKGSLLEVVVF